MITVVDERETLIRQLFCGDTFELLSEYNDDFNEVLLRVALQTTLEGKLHLGYVNIVRGTVRYLDEDVMVRKISTSVRVY